MPPIRNINISSLEAAAQAVQVPQPAQGEIPVDFGGIVGANPVLENSEIRIRENGYTRPLSRNNDSHISNRAAIGTTISAVDALYRDPALSQSSREIVDAMIQHVTSPIPRGGVGFRCNLEIEAFPVISKKHIVLDIKRFLYVHMILIHTDQNKIF
jgi:hypothetical protein